jgi:uncharacterized membrane protein
VFGVAFALTLPPLAGADEGVHFLRAWYVSNGHAFAESGHRAGDPAPDLGAYVPSGLEHGLGTLLINGELSRTNARKVWSHVRDPAPSGKNQFVDFAAAAVYPPVPYIPSAIGIRVGRLLGASPFLLVLLARLADLAAFIALVALAIRRLPSRAWILAIIALTPVAIFQAATVSADVLTTALALLVVADALALMARPVDDVPRALVVETVLVTLALALSKQPYFLAAGLLLLPAWRHRRSIGAVIGTTLAAGGVLALAWTHWANDHYLAPNFLPPSLGGHANYANNNVQTKPQLAYLQHHPFSFFNVVGRTIGYHGVSIAHDVVVQITFWHVPGVIGVLVALGLVAVVVIDAEPLAGGRPMRAFGLALAAVTVAIALFLAYVGWNALRAPRIDGFQGRYLLVVAAMVALFIRGARGRPESETRRRIEQFSMWIVGWSALMLLAVEFGLAWHSYS